MDKKRYIILILMITFIGLGIGISIGNGFVNDKEEELLGDTFNCTCPSGYTYHVNDACYKSRSLKLLGSCNGYRDWPYCYTKETALICDELTMNCPTYIKRGTSEKISALVDIKNSNNKNARFVLSNEQGLSFDGSDFGEDVMVTAFACDSYYGIKKDQDGINRFYGLDDDFQETDLNLIPDDIGITLKNHLEINTNPTTP